jgi:hypothetical protein
VGIAYQLSCQLGLPPNPFVGIAYQLSCQLGLPPNPPSMCKNKGSVGYFDKKIISIKTSFY